MGRASVTSSHKSERRKDRTLQRKLADRQAQLELVGAARDIISSWTSAAVANPVVGIVTGVIALDILHRFLVISDLGYYAGLGAIGVIEGAAAASSLSTSLGALIGGVGNIIPSIGAKASPAAQNNLLGTADNPTILSSKETVAKVSGVAKEQIAK